MIELDLAVRRGERLIEVVVRADRTLSLVGPSGAGKTTVLHAIAGLVRPERGRIVVGGRMLFDSDRRVDVPVAERGLGVAFQNARLLPHRSVEANLRYGGRRVGAEPVGFNEVVDALNLRPLLARRPRDLSGGEIKRVAVARAFLSRADALLLDEPLAALDPARAEAVLRLIERARDGGVPVVHVSHDAGEIDRLGGEVARVSDRLSLRS